MPTFADRGVSRGQCNGSLRSIINFIDRSRYFFIQVAPQLSSRGRVDPVPDPPLLGKSGSARTRSLDLRICSQELWTKRPQGRSRAPVKCVERVGFPSWRGHRQILADNNYIKYIQERRTIPRMKFICARDCVTAPRLPHTSRRASNTQELTRKWTHCFTLVHTNCSKQVTSGLQTSKQNSWIH
jgi:hypothetical protein